MSRRDFWIQTYIELCVLIPEVHFVCITDWLERYRVLERLLATVRCDGRTGDVFDIRKGIEQGYVLVPIVSHVVNCFKILKQERNMGTWQTPSFSRIGQVYDGRMAKDKDG